MTRSLALTLGSEHKLSQYLSSTAVTREGLVMLRRTTKLPRLVGQAHPFLRLIAPDLRPICQDRRRAGKPADFQLHNPSKLGRTLLAAILSTADWEASEAINKPKTVTINKTLDMALTVAELDSEAMADMEVEEAGTATTVVVTSFHPNVAFGSSTRTAQT